MRHLYSSILILMMAFGPVAANAGDETSYLNEISINSREVVKKDREVELNMVVDLSAMRLRTQHTVALTPVLVSADGSREAAFAPLVVDGRTRNKVYLRAQRVESVDLPPLHDGGAVAVIRRRNGSDQSYDYTATVPYERWMLGGRVELRELVHGCANCARGESEQSLAGNVLPAFVPDYRLCSIEPAPEPVKVRAETRTARLQFRQDSYTIRPDYRNNRAELDTVSSSIGLVKRNTDVTITGIYITGYASPEGSVGHNLKLSENRAKAMAEYIRRNDGIAASLLHVDWKGEDWVGFRENVVKTPSMLKRDEILRIIDECEDDRDQCERQIRNLVPSTIYERLLLEVYPSLRRNEYRIEYNVRNFNLEEARRMVDERPDLLSLTEMYKVAGSYGKGTAEYDHVMAVAAKYYPNEPAVVNDRAIDAMSRGDYGRAVEIVESAAVTSKTPALLNTLGVASSGAGDYRKAEDAFRRAADAGLEESKHNLKEVQGVIDQL